MSSGKPTLFIGCTSTQLNVATAVKSQLDAELDVTIWNEPGKVFELNKSTLDSLLDAGNYFDYAILILTPDDCLISKGELYDTPRDNLIFEEGLFLGRFGRNRTFIIRENSVKIPSDFFGITISSFRKPTDDKDLPNAVNEACDEILIAIKENEKCAEVGFYPATSLAVGYFENFVRIIIDGITEKKYEVTIGDEKRHIDKEKFDFTFTIIIPDSIHEIEQSSIMNIKKKNNLQPIIFYSSTRDYPLYVIGDIDPNNNVIDLYDIPTTLRSSRRVLEYIFREPAFRNENSTLKIKQEMIEKREIRNFRITLEDLISRRDASLLKNNTIMIKKSF